MSKEMEISQFLDEIQVPVSKLSAPILRQREAIWRVLWSWIDDDVKFFVIRAGSAFRVMKRDWKGTVGELGSVKFEPKEVELSVYEKTYNYNDGKYYYEKKVCKIPYSAIWMLEHITESELAEEVEQYEVEPILEEEGIV